MRILVISMLQEDPAGVTPFCAAHLCHMDCVWGWVLKQITEIIRVKNILYAGLCFWNRHIVKPLITSEGRELDQKCCDCTLWSAESALAPLAASDMSKTFYTTRLSASASRALSVLLPAESVKPAYVLYCMLGWGLAWLRLDINVGGPEFCDAFRMTSASQRCLGRWWGGKCAALGVVHSKAWSLKEGKSSKL